VLEALVAVGQEWGGEWVVVLVAQEVQAKGQDQVMVQDQVG
jgi:hypothetical protein